MPPIESPCCVYGDPCFSVCINPKCKKFGMICQRGQQNKQQCYLFHHECPQIKWSQLQKIANQNNYTSTQLKIQKMFVRTIQKIKEEQEKFRIWVKTFGHSLEVMKFIKLINDKNFEDISGSLVAPVINSYFKDENNVSKPPAIIQQDIHQIQSQIQSSIQNITSLYLRTAKRKVKHQVSMVNISSPSAAQVNQDNQKLLSKSQKYQSSPFQQTRQRHESHIRSPQGQQEQYSGQGRYYQRQQRLQGSMISQSSSMNKSNKKSPQHQMMMKFNSKIYRHIENIKKLFTHAKPISFKLLFRASQHNFQIEEFHKACDNVQNTLVLIQTQFSKVIGGFSTSQWKSNKKQWVADKKKQSFIFSLTLGEKYELNLPQFAISCNGDKGPIFGCCDICLVDRSNKQKSSAEFPISYNLGKKYHRGDQASFAFTGHPKGQYRTKEWQVFKVEFQ